MDGYRSKKIMALALKAISVKPTVPSEMAINPFNSLSEEDIIKPNLVDVIDDNDSVSSVSEEDFGSDDSIKDPDFNVENVDEKSDDTTDIDTDTERLGTLVENRLALKTSNQHEENNQVTVCMDNRRKCKYKRNIGKTYMTLTGKIIKERKVQPLLPCIKKCLEKISPTMQKQMFDEFWQCGNFKIQIVYVGGLIDIVNKKTIRTKVSNNPRNREFSYLYFMDIDNNRTNVCQKCFKATFNITDRFLRTVISKKVESSGPPSDKRGKAPSTTKPPDHFIDDVINHIKSFPAYESHYSKKHSSKMYLHSDLNLAIMYKLYAETQNVKHVSMTKYQEIFNNLGLKFKRTQLDTCTTCDEFKLKIKVSTDENMENLKIQQQYHHKEADLAYESKKLDISKVSPTSLVFTFDLQQCLPTPYLLSSVSFYKRQLNTFNLTIHDCRSGKPNCYIWHEAIGKRRGNEIASCLYEHLKPISQDIKNIIFWSDSCFGQNKNSFVALMFAIYSSTSSIVDSIEHKFLVPGHTHMECDVDHALIERKKRKATMKIHHPRDWSQFIRTAGDKNPFNETEMSQINFKDFGTLVKNKCTFRKYTVLY